jgi:hypothetical protein
MRDALRVLAPTILQLSGDVAFHAFQESTMDLEAFQVLVTVMVQSIEAFYATRATQVVTKLGSEDTDKQAIGGDDEGESAASKTNGVEKVGANRRKGTQPRHY